MMILLLSYFTGTTVETPVLAVFVAMEFIIMLQTIALLLLFGRNCFLGSAARGLLMQIHWYEERLDELEEPIL